MTTVIVRIRTAILIAKHMKNAVPRWKRWRLQSFDRDTAKKMAEYWLNNDKITAKRRVRYLIDKGANTADLNEQERV